MMTAPQTSFGDPSFSLDLAESRPYVAAIVYLYEMSGRLCGQFPMRKSRKGREHDQHDLAVFEPQEVKSRGFSFRSLDEFASGGGRKRPGTYCLAILDTCHHVEGNLARFASLARFYWIWSKDREAVIQIDVRKTIKHWVRQWLYSRNRYRAHYMCPLFASGGEPIYTPEQYRNRILQPLDGVRCHDLETLKERAMLRRQEMRGILESLKGGAWLSKGRLQSSNPGIPSPTR